MEGLIRVSLPAALRRFESGRLSLTAVIDIGSNSVRMVVFAGRGRARVPVYNERTLCGLGRALGRTGRLDREGTATALSHLARFAAIGRAMGVEQWEVVATEAVRTAKDGAAFEAEAGRILGAPVQILSGNDEAEASALGVVSGIPAADGMMGDLGGGSLEIVALDAGTPGRRATLPLGALRLGAVASDGTKLRAIVDSAFASVDWLDTVAGRTFYPVGGSWRAFAAVHMAQTAYPLHIIDHYTLVRRDALDLLRLVSRLSPKSLANIPRVPKARLAMLPLAAVVMESLLSRARPARVIFSAHGLREGWLFRKMPGPARALDPLLEGCRDFAESQSRFGSPGPGLARWIEPLFPKALPWQVRLIHAAALLSDIGWRDHPDYRSADSFRRVLHLPVTGIDHRERVILATAIGARYGGGKQDPLDPPLRALVADDDMDFAATLGRALRLAVTLSAGTADVLGVTQIALGVRTVRLYLPPDARYLLSDVAKRRFSALARRLDRRPKVIYRPAP